MQSSFTVMFTLELFFFNFVVAFSYTTILVILLVVLPCFLCFPSSCSWCPPT
jgi:hypothetical protein